MQWWIAGAGVLILTIVAARALHRPARSYRDAPLDDELVPHVASLAARPGTGRKRIATPRDLSRHILRGVQYLNRTPREELLPAAQWLSDNGRFLQETALSLKLELRRSPRLPVNESGEPRVFCLARELTGHSCADVRQALILRVTEAWQAREPLTTAELDCLPLALRAALMNALCEMIVDCEREQREANAAARFTERLLERRTGALERRFEKHRHSTAFLERLLSRLRDCEDATAAEWAGQRVARQELSPERIADAEHHRQTENRLWVGNAITSLRAIARMPWEQMTESMSLTHRALCADAVYPGMDAESRAYYRECVARVAREAGRAELAVCDAALRLASRTGRKGVEAHVGYYLLDDGLPQLTATLDAPFRLGSFLRAHAFGLLRLGEWLLVAALPFLLGSAGLTPWLWLPSCAVFLRPYHQLWGMLCARFARPRLVPRMRVDALEKPVLVVCPTLLTDREQALAMGKRLSVLHQANPDPKLHFMLLGDFADSLTATAGTDEEIIVTAAAALRALREDTGHPFFYMQRRRVLNPPDAAYISRERKRGGVETVLRALEGLPLEDAFAYCSHPRDELEGKYQYVITLDSDTILPPGAALRMVGAMLHPLQRREMLRGRMRGVSILQPRMETAAHTVGSYLSLLLGGRGGSDPYNALMPDFSQDVLGRGSYVGKGLIDPAPFLRETEGRMIPRSVLSHDLLEGELTGCAFASDITLFDGQPATLRAYLGRLHRWTRGDWQLLPYLLPFLPLGGKAARLDAVARHKLWMNLLRSLAAPCKLLLLLVAAAMGRPWLFLLTLLSDELMTLWPLDGLAPLSVATRMLALPCVACTQADAIARALWRQLVTRKNLLQWTTAAQLARPDARPDRTASYFSLGAGVLLAALSFSSLPGALLAALWLCFPLLLPWLERPYRKEQSLTDYMREELARLASETFLYFETVVTPRENHLPPDNVQLDPNKGISHRTSPTNIGLYLVSMIAACRLGLIAPEGAAERIRRALDTVEALPKWHGHLYNWYDTRTLAPLGPLFVSTVDSGNLAACLLTCAQGLRALLPELPPDDQTLSARADALASAMRFDRLYDADAELFWIGAHPEQPRDALAHYDLLASEARLTSFVAIMLGQVPVRHWYRLGRGGTRTRRGHTLVSYSGTMFEYLMPLLFQPCVRGTLLCQACAQAISEQKRFRRLGAFGVSESGYFAFDPELYYQYKAFGLPSLALAPVRSTDVIAPYASLLALPLDAKAAFLNLQRMRALGWEGALGLFEAADFQRERIGEDAPFRVVRSHMSHHQGMILCALCNALCDGAVTRLFSDLPRARAHALLLEEKPRSGRALVRHPLKRTEAEPAYAPLLAGRSAMPLCFPVDGHLLHGAGTTLFIDAQGGGYLARDGVTYTRFRERCDLPSGMRFYLRDSVTGAYGSLADPRAVGSTVFETARATFTRQRAQVESTLRFFVNPLDGAALCRVMLRNLADRERMLEICSFLEPSLVPQRDDQAHPAFQNLFVQTQRIGPCGVMALRRPRAEGEEPRRLLHALCADTPLSACHIQTDRTAFLGRGHTVYDPESLEAPLGAYPESIGDVIDPCLSIRARLTLPASGKAELLYVTLPTARQDTPGAFLERYASPDAAEKLFELAQTQGLVTARYLGLDAATQNAVSRLCGALVYTGQPHQRGGDAPNALPVSGLWALGIGGELPIFTLLARDAGDLALLRTLLKAHAFYRLSGLWTDLAIVSEQRAGYAHPLRDAISELARTSHSRELIGREGGLHLLERQDLSAEQYGLLLRASRVVLDSAKGSLADQLKAMLVVSKPRLTDFPCPTEESKSFSREELAFDNGYGGFVPSDASYRVLLPAGTLTPAPWCNVLATPRFGTLAGESGLVFSFADNSYGARLTRWPNDPVSLYGDELFFLRDLNRELLWSPTRWPLGLRLEARVTHGFGVTTYESEGYGLSQRLTVFTDSERSAGLRVLHLQNAGTEARELQALYCCAFSMSERPAGELLTRAYRERGAICAINPGFPGVACIAQLDPEPTRTTVMSVGAFHGLYGIAPAALAGDAALPCDEGSVGVICHSLTLRPGESATLAYCLAKDERQDALARLLDDLRKDGASLRLHLTRLQWEKELCALRFDLPDPALSLMLNRWLPYQVRAARLYARAGFYQAGGAYGFRDQLQDMLALLWASPGEARAHLLRCAEHQFEEGDVQHWWHPPRTGVRTRVSDDLLFLPYVAALYVRSTGDASVLREEAGYLRDAPLREGERERYATPEASALSEPLYAHCLRAIRHVALGPHGLPLMGGGDWNDGMNEVGGESVWLGMFMAETLRLFLPWCAEDDANELRERREGLLRNLDRYAWDGEWYLRAWYADGEPLGSARGEECRIDLLPQSWAAICGVSRERAAIAMDAAWNRLFDAEAGLLRLFAPPFDGRERPGYIAGYLPGVRENGGQYTHAVPWAIAALHRLGRDDRAWVLVNAALPVRHAETRAQADRYRVEPYVMAADIYANPQQRGRGGWTWYTGSAAWLYRTVVEELLGFEKTGDALRLRPRVPEGWERLTVTYRHGASTYRLHASRDCPYPVADGERLTDGTLRLVDDGRIHEASFPIRSEP